MAQHATELPHHDSSSKTQILIQTLIFGSDDSGKFHADEHGGGAALHAMLHRSRFKMNYFQIKAKKHFIL